MEKKSKNRNDRFKVRLSYEQHPQAELPLVGFLFNCHGRLLQRQLADDMELIFNLKEYQREIQIDQLRLFVAPASDKRILSVTNMQELESYKAYEPIMRSITDGEVTIQPIPEQLSIYWLFCKCRVKGKLSKWFDEGNVWKNKAVCNARVHICEIDPIQYWIQRIPDHVIAKIPEAILRPERLPEIPRPIPDPPPFDRIKRPQLEQVQENMFLKSSPMQRAKENMAKLPVISAEIKQDLATGNLATIREAIVNNYALFHPWFCFWPWWWPYFYRCKELAVVKTNASGRFDTTITYNCFGDKPDIYIWVEYFINGEWTTVYKPPVPCYTHWNYTCGNDINIQITHPEVPGDCCCNCGIGGDLVWIRSIRKHTSVSHILQTPLSMAPPNQSVAYQRIGLTDASAIGDPGIMNITVDDYKRPFGGTPMFYMGFGSDLPKNDMYHYRWSYRKVAEADLTPVASSFTPLIPKGGVVNKGYDYEYLDPNNDKQIAPNSVKLGPYSVGANDNLYIIPDQDPKQFPFPATEDNPVWHEPTYNMNTMQFDTTELEGDGLYEFMLELFDEAGNLLTNISRSTFKIPQHENAGLSRNAPDEYLIDPTGTAEGGGVADAYKMLMRFDNQGVEGEIYTVNVNGAPASLDCCGFVNYKPDGVEADLELSFKATQQNDFAVFSFGVVKGTCGSVGGANASGMVIDSANGYILGGDEVYRKTFTPGALLGDCYDNGDGKAAFGENLHIYTMATDGQFRVQRDLHDSAAFALEP